MSERHLLGDIAIACLLAIPTVAISRPQPAIHASLSSSAMVAKAAFAERTPVEKMVNLPGRS